MTKPYRSVCWLTVLLFLLASLSFAQTWSQYPEDDPYDPVMGICTGWSFLNSSSYCTLATPVLDMGSTQNGNPTFNIGMNDGHSANAMLIVLIPQASTTTIDTLTFTATFSQTGQTIETLNASAYVPLSGNPFVSNQELLQYLGLTCNANAPGSSCNCNGADYHFNSINNLQTVAGTAAYSVFAISDGLFVAGPSSKNPQGPMIVGVSFSNFSSGTGFPTGTIFLALGLQNGLVAYKTPLTLADQITGVTPVPEPVSLTLFGAGLLAVGSYVRHRTKQQRN